MDGLLDMFLLLAIVSVLSAILRTTLPVLKGRFGGLLTHLTLRHYLPASHYAILHNVNLQTGRRRLRIGHIVVSPYGIFVIETKRMVGKISGNRKDASWTRTWLRSSSRFPNPLERNDVSIKVLSRLLGLGPSLFHSLVIISGSARFRTPMPLNVTKPGGLLPFIQIRTRPLMSFEEAERIAAVIEDSKIENRTGSRAEPEAACKRGFHSAPAIFRKAAPALLVAALLLVGGGLVTSLTQDARLNAYPDQAAEEDQNPFMEHAQPPRINLPSTAPGKVDAREDQLDYPDQAEASGEGLLAQRRAGERLAWESALTCTLSADNARCSCYQPSGARVEIDFEDCKIFAKNSMEMVSH